MKQIFIPAPSAAAVVNANAAAPANNVLAMPPRPGDPGGPALMPAPAPATTPEDRRDYDEYARLVESTKAPNARKEVLRVRILAKYKHLLPAEGDIARGDEYDLDIGAMGIEHKVTAFSKLCKYLSPKRFFAMCSVTMKAFEAVVPDVDRAQFVTEARTGGRRITCTKRFKEAA